MKRDIESSVYHVMLTSLEHKNSGKKKKKNIHTAPQGELLSSAVLTPLDVVIY